MTGLAPAVRARLTAILALAEDEANGTVGERLAALAAAERLLARHNLRLRDLPTLPAAEAALPEVGSWRETCAQCLAHRDLLRPWEQGFLSDLPRFRRLSAKQRYCLREIAERVLEGAPRRAA